jgi:hypothetical protein
MFGFKQRAKEQENRATQEQAIVLRGVHAKLNVQLEEVVAYLASTHGLKTEAVVALAAKASQVRSGFDAVLIDHMYAYGPELANSETLVRGGAVVAQAVGNLAVISGHLENPNAQADLCYVLGFSRDGLQVRENI